MGRTSIQKFLKGHSSMQPNETDYLITAGEKRPNEFTVFKTGVQQFDKKEIEKLRSRQIL